MVNRVGLGHCHTLSGLLKGTYEVNTLSNFYLVEMGTLTHADDEISVPAPSQIFQRSLRLRIHQSSQAKYQPLWIRQQAYSCQTVSTKCSYHNWIKCTSLSCPDMYTAWPIVQPTHSWNGHKLRGEECVIAVWLTCCMMDWMCMCTLCNGMMLCVCHKLL